MEREIGIIGIGHVGSMLVQKFTEFNLFAEENIYASNRTVEKLQSLKEKYPSINICTSVGELAKKCSNIILCVKPLDLPYVLLEIQPYIDEKTYLMVSTSMIKHEDIRKFHTGSITIFMPTLISMVNGGVSLVYHNEHVDEKKKEYFHKILNPFSEIKVLGEEDINLSQNMTATFPGLYAEIMLEFVKAASKRSKNVSDEDLEHMLLVSLLGASRLLLEKNMSFEETIKRVSTKGGTTNAGVTVLKKMLPEVFDATLDASITRHDEMSNAVSNNIEELVSFKNREAI